MTGPAAFGPPQPRIGECWRVVALDAPRFGVRDRRAGCHGHGRRCRWRCGLWWRAGHRVEPAVPGGTARRLGAARRMRANSQSLAAASVLPARRRIRSSSARGDRRRPGHARSRSPSIRSSAEPTRPFVPLAQAAACASPRAQPEDRHQGQRPAATHRPRASAPPDVCVPIAILACTSRTAIPVRACSPPARAARTCDSAPQCYVSACEDAPRRRANGARARSRNRWLRVGNRSTRPAFGVTGDTVAAGCCAGVATLSSMACTAARGSSRRDLERPCAF